MCDNHGSFSNYVIEINNVLLGFIVILKRITKVMNPKRIKNLSAKTASKQKSLFWYMHAYNSLICTKSIKWVATYSTYG